MKFISITGGVGTGKSTVLDFLGENYNCKIVKADDVAKDLMKPGTDTFLEICEKLGKLDIFKRDEGGEIIDLDNDKLAKLIFNDPRRRMQLNFIVHPAVKNYILRDFDDERKRKKYDYYFFEAALIIEEGYDKISDETWYVNSSLDERVKRLKSSRGYSDKRIEGMLKSQQKDEFYIDHADYVINNNKSQEDTFQQIREHMLYIDL